MKVSAFPMKLHVLLAREAGRALVIRQGPSAQTCVFSWNRETNQFQIAHWFKGRIYERRSDMSPDGRYWIYFAMNGKWQSETSGAWTTVAPCPQLKAISLYAKGNCWNGGGLFLNNRSFWLNDGLGHVPLFESDRVHRNSHYHPPNHYGRECPHVYYNRLQRDGWRLVEQTPLQGTSARVVFDRSASENWILHKICFEEVSHSNNRGNFYDTHQLIHDGDVVEKPDWEWADCIDGRILYCAHGCLFQQRFLPDNSPGKPELLHDFNSYSFKRRMAGARHSQQSSDDTIAM